MAAFAAHIRGLWAFGPQFLPQIAANNGCLPRVPPDDKQGPGEAPCQRRELEQATYPEGKSRTPKPSTTLTLSSRHPSQWCRARDRLFWAKVPLVLRSPWSASNQATRRIAKAGPSWGPPANCLIGHYQMQGSIGVGSTSPTPSSTSSSSNAESAAFIRNRRPARSSIIDGGWTRN